MDRPPPSWTLQPDCPGSDPWGPGGCEGRWRGPLPGHGRGAALTQSSRKGVVRGAGAGIHGARSGAYRALLSPWRRGACAPREAHRTPYDRGLGGCVMWAWLFLLVASRPLPSLGKGGGAGQSKLRIVTWPPEPTQLPTWSPRRAAPSDRRHSPRQFQGIQGMCVRNRGRIPNIGTKGAPGALVTRELQ